MSVFLQLDFVCKYTAIAPEPAEIYERIRLVLNQKGIKRIEQMPV